MSDKNSDKIKKIILAGGGTGGSVMPLLAIAAELRRGASAKYDFLFVGTSRGPERELVKKENIEFRTISSGKFRRYFSYQNFIDPLRILLGFFQSLLLILKWRPNLVVSAGGFVAVPLTFAAWILRTPIIIHQQDVRAGLANKLMAPFARIITVTFEKSLYDYGKKAVLIGNPFKIESGETNIGLNFSGDLPLVLVIGGGTGSMFINNLVRESLPELTKFCQLVHIVGPGKLIGDAKFNNYWAFEFMEHARLFKIMELADVVVSRCGLGVLTELSYLNKPSILIPMPRSHQEDNARVFQERGAAIILEEKNLTAEIFIASLKDLLINKKLRNDLRSSLELIMKSGAAAKLTEIIQEIIPA